MASRLAAPRWPNRTLAGLKAQSRVIGALVLRELHTRYGRENIGYLWLIGEPMLLASVITLIHLNAPTRYGSDIGPAPFSIVGYTFFIIFRNTFNRADGVVEHNQSLLYHRMVSVFDVVFSRVTMEVLGCFATTTVLMCIAILFGYAQLPVRPLYLLTAGLLMAWWTLGLTMIAAAATYRNEIIGRQLHVMSYLSMPISGAFFEMRWLPHGFRDGLSWFPMALIFEQARYGQFRSASPDYVAPGYVALWCTGLTFLGLILIRQVRGKVYG